MRTRCPKCHHTRKQLLPGPRDSLSSAIHSASDKSDLELSEKRGKKKQEEEEGRRATTKKKSDEPLSRARRAVGEPFAPKTSPTEVSINGPRAESHLCVCVCVHLWTILYIWTRRRLFLALQVDILVCVCVLCPAKRLSSFIYSGRRTPRPQLLAAALLCFAGALMRAPVYSSRERERR